MKSAKKGGQSSRAVSLNWDLHSCKLHPVYLLFYILYSHVEDMGLKPFYLRSSCIHLALNFSLAFCLFVCSNQARIQDFSKGWGVRFHKHDYFLSTKN